MSDEKADTLPPPDPSTVELASLVPDRELTSEEQAAMIASAKLELLSLTKAELENLPRFSYEDTNYRGRDCQQCFRCSDCVECVFCYDCSGCDGCSHCRLCVICVDCNNCLRCYDCVDCDNCVDCIGLHMATGLCFVAYGIQLSEAEYQGLLAKLNAPDEPPDSSEGEAELEEDSDTEDEG